MESTIQNSIVASLLRLGAYLIREGNRLCEDCGLTQQQFVVLRFIGNHGPISQRKICSGLVFEKSHVSKIIKKLRALEVVEIIQSEKDLRVKLIVITDKGNQITNRMMSIFEAWNQNWLKDLTPFELGHTDLTLRRLSELVKPIN